MENSSDRLEIVAELPIAPGNITVTLEGRIILSLHQFYAPQIKVAELTQDGIVPICDGITIDQENNIYLGDLANNGIGVITPDRFYQILVTDEKLSWTDSLSFSSDGYLYLVCNQLHRSAPLNAGEDISMPPYYILRLKPLASRVV